MELYDKQEIKSIIQTCLIYDW